MRSKTPLLFLFLVLVSRDAISQTTCTVDIDNLLAPSLYDNTVVPVAAGQTFIAVSATVSGIRLFIGDPTRPGDPSVGPIQGPADLILLDATDLANPVELERTKILPFGSSLSGELDFMLSSPVSTVVGTRYFLGLSASTGFGLGLSSDQTTSTYAGGSEASLDASGITEHATGRDASFQVYGDCPPQSGTLSGTLNGLTLGKLVCKNTTTGQGVKVKLVGATSWDCTAAGLIVNPGDAIVVKLKGLAD